MMKQIGAGYISPELDGRACRRNKVSGAFKKRELQLRPREK